MELLEQTEREASLRLRVRCGVPLTAHQLPYMGSGGGEPVAFAKVDRNLMEAVCMDDNKVAMRRPRVGAMRVAWMAEL